jgi:type IV secretory pathway TrbF-like protein
MLLRNTSLYNNKNKLGLFESSNPFQDGITRVTSTPTMSHKDWKHAYDLSLWMQTHYNNKSNQILTEQNSYYKTKSKKLLTKIGQFRYSQQNFKIRNNIKHSEKNNINTSNDKHLKL